MTSGFVRPSDLPDGRVAEAASFIPGAEPIALDAGSRGVLILHGFGDTPQSIRGLGSVLHASQWTVRAPALRGHGSTLAAFTSARADEWISDVRGALQQLRTRSSRVAIIGQSMGGALATILAAEARVDALILLVPFLRLSPRASAMARFHRTVALFKPYLHSRSESSILDPVAKSNALGRGVTTPRLLHELSLVVRQAREAAVHLRAPTLVIHSRQDPRISMANARAAFTKLGTPVKRLAWVEHSGHVVSVDRDRDVVATRALDWLEAHAPPE